LNLNIYAPNKQNIYEKYFCHTYYDTSKIIHSNQLEGLELASFNRRFWALFIDLIALALILFILGTILNYLGLIDFGFSVGISNGDTPIEGKGLEYHASDFFNNNIEIIKFRYYIWD